MKNWKNIAGYITIIIAFAALIVVNDFNRKNKVAIATTDHIKIVSAVGRACNDCHLGASFISLFLNDAVAGNDNIVNKIMDEAKIKRW